MAEESFSFQTDFVGRIRNISLAPSPQNALTPVFEAVTNSIHAIEERFKAGRLNEGRIVVTVLRDETEGAPVGFQIEDNGVGMNSANFQAFRTGDTRNKIVKGGKGVGRFLWIKVFARAFVKSNYEVDGEIFSRKFVFASAEEKQITEYSENYTKEGVGTTILLEPFNSEYRDHCPKKSSTIKSKLVSHFLRFIVAEDAPTITLQDEGEAYDLKHEFRASVEREAVFQCGGAGEFEAPVALHALLLPKEYSDDEKGTNAVYYAAHGRSVRRFDLDSALGMKEIQSKFAFFGLVESELFDRFVNQERTDFGWPDDFFESVHRSVIDRAKEFLSPEIDKIRERQTALVTRVRDEHLRFLNVVREPEEYAKSLPLNIQTSEEIFLELSRTSLRVYNNKKRQFNDSKKKKLPDFESKAKEFTQELERESLSSLAECIYKRKLILDVLDDRMAYSDVDSKSFHLEEAVHELICPLRESTDTLTYKDHNLWIVDDALSFYTYFNSDTTIRKTTGGLSKSTDETDIAIFDLGMGFEQPKSANPISIIEFKRPGRDDYRLACLP